MLRMATVHASLSIAVKLSNADVSALSFIVSEDAVCVMRSCTADSSAKLTPMSLAVHPGKYPGFGAGFLRGEYK